MIVRSEVFPHGIAHMCDDSCANLSREEYDARLNRMHRTAEEIRINIGRRRQEEAAQAAENQNK